MDGASDEETLGWIAGIRKAFGYCLPCKQEESIEVKTNIITLLLRAKMENLAG